MSDSASPYSTDGRIVLCVEATTSCRELHSFTGSLQIAGSDHRTRAMVTLYYEFIVVPFIIALRSSLRATGKRNVPPHSLHLAASTPRTRNQRARDNKATNNASICQMKRMPESLQPQTRSSFDRFRRGATKYP